MPQYIYPFEFALFVLGGYCVKRLRQKIAVALAYIAASPFLFVGFVRWMFKKK